MKYCLNNLSRTMWLSLIVLISAAAQADDHKSQDSNFSESKSGIVSEVTDYLSGFQGTVAPAITFDQMPYKDAGTEAAATFLVMGRIGRLFFEGNRFGYVAHRGSFGAISAVGQVRSHQYLPSEEDKAMEVGLQHSKRLGMGWFSQVTFFTDVSDTHKGHELELSAYRRDHFGDFTLLTMLALQQQSKALTGYFSDDHQYEVSEGDLNSEIEFIGTYPLTENFRLVGVYRHYFNGQGLTDSPLTDSDQTRRFILGIGWSF